MRFSHAKGFALLFHIVRPVQHLDGVPWIVLDRTLGDDAMSRVLKRPESGWARTKRENNIEATVGIALIFGTGVFIQHIYGVVLIVLEALS